MSKLSLDFKFKTVANIERKTGKSFFNLFNDMSVTTLGMVMSECGKSDEEIQSAFAELGVDGVIAAMMEDLRDAGFLPKATEIPDLTKMTTK